MCTVSVGRLSVPGILSLLVGCWVGVSWPVGAYCFLQNILVNEGVVAHIYMCVCEGLTGQVCHPIT